jgi:hypothetical protein
MSDPDDEDATQQLAEMLDATGARVTFDRGRNNQNPCTFCGASIDEGSAHRLRSIGFYPNGDLLTRPVCDREACVAIANIWESKLIDVKAGLEFRNHANTLIADVIRWMPRGAWLSTDRKRALVNAIATLLKVPFSREDFMSIRRELVAAGFEVTPPPEEGPGGNVV